MSGPPPIEGRAEVLRLEIANSTAVLEVALARLGRVGAEQFTVGGFISKDPWPWLVGACLAGAVLGLRR